MSSYITHKAKREAYENSYLWDKRWSEECAFYSQRKEEAHKEYVKIMEESGKYWYGTAPRSRLLNWIAHKLLFLAWGKIEP